MALQARASRQAGQTSSRRRSAQNGAQDATLRNVRAANKRLAILLARVERLEAAVKVLRLALKAGR